MQGRGRGVGSSADAAGFVAVVVLLFEALAAAAALLLGQFVAIGRVVNKGRRLEVKRKSPLVGQLLGQISFTSV